MNTLLKCETLSRRLCAMLMMALVLLAATPMPMIAAEPMKQHKPTLLADSSSAEHLNDKRPSAAELTRPIPRVLVFNENPSDLEIEDARLFPEPLVPMDNKNVFNENHQLAEALLAFKKKGDADNISDLSQFISSHPNSRWVPALEMNMGENRFELGYFRDALKYWEAAWNSSKKQTLPARKAVADHSISNLLLLEARLGNTDSLKNHRAEIERRSMTGTDEARVKYSSDGLWTQQNHEELAYKCGPAAIEVLARLKKPADAGAFHKLEMQKHSTKNGTNLAQLQEWSKEFGLDMQMVKRSPGSKIIVPAIMHLAVGHFAAVLAEDKGRYRIQDRTFDTNASTRLSAKVIDSESDGFFLVPKGALPPGWQPVSKAEAAQVWGKGFTTGRDDSKPPTSPHCPLPGGGCKGMATASAFTMDATLNIQDMPVGYNPPLGGSMMQLANYNYNEASQPTSFTFTNIGANWSLNFVSYLTLDGSSNITLRDMGGGTEIFNISNGAYPIGQYTQAQMLNLGGGSYQRVLPDGSAQNYTLSDGTNIYMTSTVDPQNNATTISYDAKFRLVSITDACGNPPTIFTYVSNTFGNAGFYKVATITDGLGRTATFVYDSATTPTFLTSITDSVGNVSKFLYDTSTSFISMMTTPYGSTWFYQYTPTANFINPPVGLRAVFPDGTSAVVENWLDSTRNSYYWDREATMAHPSDPANFVYSNCKTTAFLTSSVTDLEIPIVSWIRNALEAPLVYFYAGEGGGSGLDRAGPINQPVSISRQTNPFLQTITLTGSATAGDKIGLEVGDALTPVPAQLFYTVQSGDTLNNVASGLASAINSSGMIQAYGMTATVAANVVTVTSLSTIGGAIDQHSSSGSGSEILTFNFVVNVPQAQYASGSTTVGDVVTVTAHNSALPGGTESVSYTVKTNDYLQDICQGLAIAANSDSALQTIGLSATWTSQYFRGNQNPAFRNPAINFVTSTPTTYTVTSPGSESFSGGQIDFAPTVVQAWNYQRNALGKVTQYVDPLGRQFSYSYAPNNIDLLEVSETQPKAPTHLDGGDNALSAHYEYNAPTAPHLPSLSVDGSAQQTQYTYNSFGQLATTTDANGSVTTLVYDAITPIAIGGTASGSRTETITVGGHTATYVTTSSDTLATIASSLGTQINALNVAGISASVVGTTIQVNAPSGTTFSDTTAGAITISSITPVVISGSVASSHVETITVAGSNANFTAVATDTPSSIASGLASAITTLALTGVSAVAVGPTVEISTPLGTSITGTPSGGVAIAVGSPTSKGAYLAQIQGPLSGGLDVTNLSFNLSGTPSSVTDSEGYTLNYSYDAMDRTLSTLYLDGTSEQTIYDRLDAVLRSDRIGRWTRSVYDSMDQLSCETDPLGRTTKYCWCACGSLSALTDPQNNTTNWQHDIEGRVVKKIYADGSNYNYAYEPSTGRLASKTDALGHITAYAYNLDNSLQQKVYTDAAVPTSTVDIAYDSIFARSKSVANGWGTNSYGYNPYSMIWLNGATPTPGDFVQVLVRNAALSGHQYQFKYTVQAGTVDNTLTKLATNIKTAINADTTLSTAGITATATGATVTLAGTGNVNVSPHTNGVVTELLGGTITAGDRVSIIVTDTGVSNGSFTASHNVVMTDTLPIIATDLAGQIHSSLSSSGIDATASTNSVIITSTSPNATTYSTLLSASAHITIAQSGGPTEFADGTVPNNFGNNRLASATNNVITNSDTTYTFDALGRTTNRSINGASNSTTWNYDAISRVTSEVDPLGTFNYTYVDDVSGSSKGVSRLASIGYPNSQTTNFSYLPNIGDQRLQQIANLNPSAAVLSQFNYAFDASGQIKQWQQQQNSVNTHLNLGYDQASQLTASTSDTGSSFNAYISGTPHIGDVVTVTAYDASLTGTTPKGQETASYTVATGNTAANIASGLATAIGTAMSNVSVIASATGSVISISTSSSFATQFTCAVTGSGATTTIALSGSSPINNTNLHKQIYYNYDCAGNRTGVEGDSTGTLPTLSTTATQYSYNNLNQLTDTAAGGPIRFQATTTNPVKTAVVNVNQSVTIGGSITNGNVLTLTVHDPSLGTPQSFSYTVNTAVDTTTTLIAAHFVSANSAALALIGITATSATNVINLTSTSINVSSFSTSTNAGATETLTVGRSSGAYAVISPTNAFVANPVLAGGSSSTANTAAVTATSGGGTATTNNYTINIAAQTPQTLLYDANGNMTSDGTNTYSWDACDRLVQITYPGSGNNSQFSYDGLGRCVQITENVSGTPTTLEFVWCGSKRCETRNGTGFGTVVSQFFGMGEVIGGTSYFYTKDHLGSVREMTKTVAGITTTVAEYGYDPYGIKSNVITEVVPSDFQYAGYYFHARSGLNLTRTRAYSPSMGRFIARDFLAEAGGANLYSYAANNAMSFTDPSGLLTLRGGISHDEGKDCDDGGDYNPGGGRSGLISDGAVGFFGVAGPRAGQLMEQALRENGNLIGVKEEFQAADVWGEVKTWITDGSTKQFVIEAKYVTTQYLTSQLRALAQLAQDTGRQGVLIINQGATISAPARQYLWENGVAVYRYGVIFVEETGTVLTPWVEEAEQLLIPFL